MSRKTSTNNSTDSTNELLSKLIKKLEEVDLLQREVIIAVRSITEDNKNSSTANNITAPERQTGTSFKVGDLVQVTNRIRQPFGGLKRATGNPRGVVVRITKRRIHIKLSDTGLIIQRDPSNVRHQAATT
jgi:hypothetical protein